MDSNNYNNNNNPDNYNQDNDNYFYNNYNYNRLHDPADKHMIMAGNAQMAGLLSLPLAITGFFGFVASGLGIMLAILSKGTQKKYLQQAKRGIIYGTIGLVFNIVVIGYTMYPVLTHPTEYLQIVTDYTNGEISSTEFMDELIELMNSSRGE